MSREERTAQKKVVDGLRLKREAKEVPSNLHRQHLAHEYYEHQQLSAASSPDASCPTTRGREQGQRHERRLNPAWDMEVSEGRSQRGLDVHRTRKRGNPKSTKKRSETARTLQRQRGQGLYSVSEGLGTLEDRRRMEEQGQKGTLNLESKRDLDELKVARVQRHLCIRDNRKSPKEALTS